MVLIEIIFRILSETNLLILVSSLKKKQTKKTLYLSKGEIGKKGPLPEVRGLKPPFDPLFSSHTPFRMSPRWAETPRLKGSRCTRTEIRVCPVVSQQLTGETFM